MILNTLQSRLPTYGHRSIQGPRSIKKVDEPVYGLLKSLDDSTVRFISGVDGRNFAQTNAGIGANEFHNRVAGFITDCRGEKAEFRGGSFHRLLGPDVVRIYNRNQDVYKAEAKYPRRFELVRDYLPKKGTMLDWGLGDGGFARFVQDRTELKVAGCDVIDWRSETAKQIPFYRLDSHLSVLPNCKDEQFDTVVLMYVLHHIDPQDLPQVLEEVMRVCRRNVIIVEDIFGVEKTDAINLCPISREFAALPHDSQLQVIKMRDYLRNIVMFGIEDMNMPFEFQPIDQWHGIFYKQGWKIADTKVVGFNSADSWCNTSFNAVFNLKK